MVKIYLKNMVCNRCIYVVENELHQMHIQPISVKLGEVELQEEMDENVYENFKNKIQVLGFDIIDDRKKRWIEQIKTLIIELIHHKNADLKINLSDYISSSLNYDYTYLSNLFSDIESTTIEKYYIAQKVERAKELLNYNELNLTEIADYLNYSSVAHLSSQFKKLTGLSPSQYKKSTQNMRTPLDHV